MTRAGAVPASGKIPQNYARDTACERHEQKTQMMYANDTYTEVAALTYVPMLTVHQEQHDHEQTLLNVAQITRKSALQSAARSGHSRCMRRIFDVFGPFELQETLKGWVKSFVRWSVGYNMLT